MKDYSLSIVLASLFLVSWIGQGVTQWKHEENQAQQHGQTLTRAEFLPSFWEATFENWQSEFLQLFTMIVLTSLLVHKGAPESKSEQEKTDRALARIEARLEELSGQRGGRGGTSSSRARP